MKFTKRKILIIIFGICLIIILCGASFILGEFDSSITPHFDYNGFVDLNVERQIDPYLLSYLGGAGDTSFSQISDFSNLNKNGSIQKQDCKNINVQQLLYLINRGAISDKNPPAWQSYSKCEEYVVSDNFSVIDFKPEASFEQAILVKIKWTNVNGNPNETSTEYHKLIEDLKEYPAWNYSLEGVDKRGNIYFSYGGWRYLAPEVEGYKKFIISFSDKITRQ